MSIIPNYTQYPAFSQVSPSGTDSYPSQLTPRYFVSLGNGLATTLIPATELPFHIRLQGVRRQMRMDECGGMHFVGEYQPSGQFYRLDSPPPATAGPSSVTTPMARSVSNELSSTRYQAPDAAVRQVLSGPRHSCAPYSTPQSDNFQAMIDGFVETAATSAQSQAFQLPLPPSGKRPDPKKKEYCVHWIKHGECDFLQQGCFYKHEMPDLDKLQQIAGVRDYPKWWRDKNAVGRAKAVLNSERLQDWRQRRIGSRSISSPLPDRTPVKAAATGPAADGAGVYDGVVATSTTLPPKPPAPSCRSVGESRTLILDNLIDLDVPYVPALEAPSLPISSEEESRTPVAASPQIDANPTAALQPPPVHTSTWGKGRHPKLEFLDSDDEGSTTESLSEQVNSTALHETKAAGSNSITKKATSALSRQRRMRLRAEHRTTKRLPEEPPPKPISEPTCGNEVKATAAVGAEKASAAKHRGLRTSKHAAGTHHCADMKDSTACPEIKTPDIVIKHGGIRHRKTKAILPKSKGSDNAVKTSG